MTIRRALRFFVFGTGLLVLLVLGLELTGQALFRAKEGRWLFRGSPRSAFEYSFEHHPYLIATPRPGIRAPLWGKQVTINTRGTRWTGAGASSPEPIKIACVGGSETFGSYLNDAETWPAQLQKALGDSFDVYNYGMLGYSTAEHIVQLSLVIPEVDPDIVVFYTGWNDLREYHRWELSPDYLEHGMEQYERFDLRPEETLSIWPEIAERSGSVRLVQFAASLVSGTDAAASEPTTTWRYTGEDSRVDELYQRNLKSLIALADAHGVQSMFVPIVVNATAFEQSETEYTPYLQNQAVPALIAHFNDVLSNVCAQEDCRVLQDVLNVQWGPRHFLDGRHFSTEGSELLARTVADNIRSYVAGNPSLLLRAEAGRPAAAPSMTEAR